MSQSNLKPVPHPATRAGRVLLTCLLAYAALLAASSGASAALPTGFADELIVGDLSQPAGMAWLPDGRMLVVEQKTRDVELVRFQPLGNAAIFTVPDVQTAGNEQGLLGIAVDPAWPVRPYIYLYFDRTPGQVIYIRRYQAAGDLTDATSLAVTLSNPYNILVDIPDTASNHNGGTLHFGPDGMLYASLGDDAVGCDAQSLSELQGKILRLNVAALPDTGSGPPLKSLVTPADNPYVGDPSANGKLVYNLGLRNPFRFTIDPTSGELYVGDVGNTAWEELDESNSGDNLGWPRREGAHAGPLPGCAGSNGEDPIAEYSHTGFGSLSIIAGPRYHPLSPPRSNNLPADYNGDVFFLDYYEGFVRRYRETSPGLWQLAPVAPGQPDATNWATGIQFVSDMQVGPDGGLWYVKQGFPIGEVRRIRPTTASSAGDTGLGGMGRLSLAIVSNPVRPGGPIEIGYALPRTTALQLSVHDVAGGRVATLYVGRQEAGYHRTTWNGLDDRGGTPGSGIYFVRIETTDAGSASAKITAVR